MASLTSPMRSTCTTSLSELGAVFRRDFFSDSAEASSWQKLQRACGWEVMHDQRVRVCRGALERNRETYNDAFHVDFRRLDA